MNGRCDNDPLDPADNVCDLCGGDFCISCLITPKGRKKPWCKKCALDRSGVRGGVKTKKKSSKRDARSRRKELTETRGERDDGRFIFFDEPESEFEVRDLGEPEPEESGESRRRKVSLGIRKNKAEPATEDDAEVTPAASEETTYVASDAPAPRPADQTAATAAAPPPTAADAIAPEPTSTELLARLEDHLPESVSHTAEATSGLTSSSMPSLDSKFDPSFDPFAIPDGPAGMADEAESFDSFDASDGFDPQKTASDGSESDPTFDFDDSSPPPPPAAPPAEHTPIDEPAQQPSLLDRLGGEQAIAVSRVAPVSEAEFLRGDQEDTAFERAAHERAEPDDARVTYSVDDLIPDSSHTEPDNFEPDNFEPDQSETEDFEAAMSGGGGKGEDTDDGGNWIPPALRGMAPVEVRETLSLPKRGRA